MHGIKAIRFFALSYENRCADPFPRLPWSVFEREYREEGERKGRAEGRGEGVIIGTVDVYRDEMGYDDDTIISKLIKKFKLSPNDALSYVKPQIVWAAQRTARSVCVFSSKRKLQQRAANCEFGNFLHLSYNFWVFIFDKIF